MRKLFTLLILLFLWAGSSWGQVNTYSFVQSSGTYTAITGTTSTAAGDDGTQISIPIGFNFTYNEAVRTTFSVTTNGAIAFGSSAPGYSNLIGTAVNTVAPLWDDNNLTGGTIIYSTTGTSGSRVCTIQWTNCHIGGTGSSSNPTASFQVRLYETTNVVDIIYGGTSGALSSTTASIGISGATGNYLSVTPGAPATVSSTTANNSISSATFFPSGTIYTFTPPVVATPPNCATLVSPADAGTNVLPAATLNWASGGGAPTGYNIYFGAGSLPGTYTDLGNVTTFDPSPDLAYSTTYYWMVVPYNTIGPATGCPTWTFTTGPDPTISSFPYTQNFDGTWSGTPAAPYGWIVINANSDGYAWRQANTYITPTHSEPYAAVGMGNTNDYLITPPINVGSLDTRIKWWDKVESASYINSYKILVSTTTPDIASFTNDLGTFNCANTAWTEHIIDLSSFTGTIYVAFYQFASAATYYGFGIDDVTIEELPSCLEPTALVANNITYTSANLQWTEAGTATAWEYVYGEAPLAEPTSPGTATSSSTVNPISPLIENTSYQFWVRANCGGSFSEWVGPVSFFTGYCIPAPTSVDGLGITNVTFSTVNNTTGAEAGNYGDYSALFGDVNRDATVPVAITYQTGFTYVTKIWIDWNNDLDFDDAGEEVYSGTSLATNPTTLEASFVVPSDAPLGNHRMRIGGADVGPPTPCYTGSYGSYEDYTVNVLEALPVGSLSGKITDCYTSGDLAGVTVTAGSLPATTTNATGNYSFANVTIGTYMITASLAGYNTNSASGVVVTAGANTRADICLNVVVDPPLNLQASVTNQDVNLTWNAPGDLPDTEELIYDNDITTGAYSYEGYTMSTHMSPQGPCKILTLKYFTTIQPGDNTFNAEVYDWDAVGETPGTTLLYQVGATAVDENWMEIDISSQNITVSGDFMVGFGSINATTFVGYDANLDNGRSWDFDPVNIEWAQWIEAYLIRAIVEYGDGTRQELTAVPVSKSIYAPITNLISKHKLLSGKFSANQQLTPTNIAGVQIEKSIKHNTTAPIKNKVTRTVNSIKQSFVVTENGRAPLSTLTGYNVYRDDIKIASNITPLLYNDLNLDAGIYEYKVTAQYLEGESAAAGPVLAEVITCEAPIDLTVTVTTNSAVLSWTPQGTATSWNVEWGPAGFVQGSGTIVNVSSPTTTLNSLTPGNQYSFYVRSYCGAGDESYWAGPKTFRPHFFDCPAGSTAELEPCGDDTNGGCNMATPAFDPITLGQTICGTGYFSGTNRDTDWFTFTLTATTNVTLTGRADFDISIGFIASPCPVTTFIVSATALAGATATVTTQLAAGTYYAFVGPQFTGVFGCGEADRYQLTLTGTTCLDIPTALAANNIQLTSADLSWTSAGSLWEIEYGVAGFAHGEGTLITGISTPSYTLEDLTSSTTYTYYVRTNCGSDLGAWSLPYTFNTACATIGLPWTENFDAVVTPSLPPCWYKENGDWMVATNSLSTYDADARSGAQFLRNSWLATNEYIWTPGFALTAGTSYDFSFWWAGDDYAGWTGDVFYSPTQSSLDATQLGVSFVTDAMVTTKTYAQETNNFVPSTSGIYYFAIRVNCPTSTPWYLSFDDFSVVQSAPPTKTLNLTDVRLEHLFVVGSGGMMNQAYNATGPQYAAGIADMITVELHDATTYSTIIHSATVALSTSGTASVTDIPGTLNGSYRITIRHRNSIETTSALPVDFSAGIVSYAFDTDPSSYMNNLKLVDGYYLIYGGDVNQDGQVEGADVSAIENGVNNFASGYLAIDVDGNGDLGISDYTIWENNNNAFVQKKTP